LKNEIDNYPIGWKEVKIEEIANTSSGGTPSRTNAEYYGGSIPWVKSGELRNGIISHSEETITEVGVKDSSAKIFPSGTLLVALYGATAGKVGILSMDSATNQAVCAIFPKEITISKYLFYSLIHKREDLLGERYGGAQPNISQMILKSFKVPLPPLPEQKAIAKVLSTVQRAIEVTEQVIQSTKELKKSLMKYLFTYGAVPLDEADKVKLKETEIGMVPEEWKVVELLDIAKHRKESINPSSQLYIYVGLEHIDSGVSYLRRFGHSEQVKSTKYKYYEGDVLYGKLRPYLDKAVLTDSEGICSTDIIVLKAKDRSVRPRFLLDLIHSEEFIIYSTKTMSGVNLPRTSWSTLKNYKLATPPYEEQCEIERLAESVDMKIQLEENRRTALEQLFKTLLNNLMTGKIRVSNFGEQENEARQ